MLEKFLKKIGVKSYLDLNAEEKETYREWEIALSGRKLTDKDVKEWLETEKEIASSRVCEEGLSEKVLIFRQVELRLIKKIINFIQSPLVEKQFTEKSIEQLIKN